jgi:hypothetical protein
VVVVLPTAFERVERDLYAAAARNG